MISSLFTDSLHWSYGAGAGYSYYFSGIWKPLLARRVIVQRHLLNYSIQLSVRKPCSQIDQIPPQGDNISNILMSSKFTNYKHILLIV